MANESDDECDLDTLSALLEEDNSNDSTSQGKNAAEDASSVAGSKAGGAAQGDGDELDEEALASLLEHDSDLDDWSTQEEKSQNDCTANDIAAFFNKKSDSESETEDSQEGKLVMAMGEETSQASESEGQEVTTEETSASRSHCPPESSGQDVSSQGEPGHVTNLQDELAMMQKRMMEIQQLIASQSQSAATTASSQPAKTCVTAGKSQRHSSSTSPKASSSQRSSKSAEDKGKHLKKNNGTSSSKAASSNGLSSLSSSSKSSKLNSNSSIHATSKEQSSETTSSSIRSHSKEIAHRSRKPAHETSKSSYKSEKHKTSRHSDVAEKRGTSSSHKNSPASTLRQSGTTNSPASTLRQSGTTNSPASTLRQSGTTNSPASTLRQSGTTNSPASTLRQSGTTNSPASTLRQSGTSNNSNKTHFRDSDTGSKSAWQEERTAKKHISPETKNGSHSAKKESQQGESSKTSAFLNDIASREEKEEGSRKEMKHALTDIASRGEKKEENRKDMKRTLFGDGDSDSDWDDLEGAGDQGNLSSAGRDIKRLMRTGERQRQAHTPSYPLPASAPLSTSWKPKPQVSNSALSESRPSTHHSASKPAIKREAEDKDCMTEKHTGLRVKNPKISSIMLGSKMEGRRMIPLSKLHLKVKSPDLQSDWVTIGVIVKKSDSRKSQTGKTFSIWTLSDLQDSDTTVSFFLFGQVYKQLWKTGAGTVIGLLNPSIMDSMEKNPGEVAFTINNAAQLMDVGQSRDLGWCIGKTKRGATCTNFINKKFGDFCTYHVQTAYRKQSAKRSELHGSCPGTTPKSSLKSKIFGGDTFFYGGETFISSKGKGCGGGKKDTVTLGKLQAQATQQDQRKVSTLSIQGLVPADQVKVETKMASQHEQPFIKMLAVPSPGSMNLVKHMAKQEGCNEDGTDTNGTGKSFQSVQAIDLLKQHRQEIAQRLSQRKQQAAEAQHSKAQSATATQSDGKPVIGKGFYPGAKIDLFFDDAPRKSHTKSRSAEAAKRKAIEKVQAKGGIAKVDPNSVRSAAPDPERVRKRVIENIENESKDKGERSSPDDSQPARKRSRLLGNVDPNSEEVKQLLKARSSHTGALAQAEADREDRYFDNLEKKEMMEEKMKSVTSMEVSVVTCAQCKYTAMSVGERCKQEGHSVKRHKGRRTFFACKKCKHRTVSLHRYPTSPCKKCGEQNFEKASMHKEKSGPKLESETLCLRGDESKFIGAMEEKVYMATLEQE